MKLGTKPNVILNYGDCIEGMQSKLEPDCIDLIVTSIPFENLFIYSGRVEDVGNHESEVDLMQGTFALNMRFVANGMFRVLKPGGVACIHVQQLLAYKNLHGFIGRRNFRDATVRMFEPEGFHWTGEFAIQKDPQRIANAMNLLSLQFKTGRERCSTQLAPVFNDYVLIFRKPGDKEVPVRPFYHPTKNPQGWIKPNEHGVICPDWVRDAHGIWVDLPEDAEPDFWLRSDWTDIDEIDVIDTEEGMKKAKEVKTERHPCPLQISVIQRLVRLYSNPITVDPDSTILDPFMGIGSTAFTCIGGRSRISRFALEAPRNVIGFELKQSYHAASVNYVRQVLDGMTEKAVEQADLFGDLEPETEAAA